MDPNIFKNPNVCTFKSKNRVKFVFDIVRLLVLVLLMLSFASNDSFALQFVSYIAIFIALMILVIFIVAFSSLKTDDNFITVRLLFFDFQKINYKAITKLKYSVDGFSIIYTNRKNKELKLRTLEIETPENLKRIILSNNSTVVVELYNGILDKPLTTVFKRISLGKKKTKT